ncbi:50S ribosomal protein L17 [Candidatus Woesebacteria bacterium]|nr:50S ribosomal protein L17 [Candidatus Woesebacteria bacterium]
MRKRVFGRQLSRGGGARIALFRSLIKALVKFGKISTTKARAKAIQGEVDKIMTQLRKVSIPPGKNIVSAKRLVLSKLGGDRETVEKLFREYAKVTLKRQSGFTRIVNLSPRKGDQAKLVRLEFVDKPVIKKNENISTKK